MERAQCKPPCGHIRRNKAVQAVQGARPQLVPLCPSISAGSPPPSDCAVGSGIATSKQAGFQTRNPRAHLQFMEQGAVRLPWLMQVSPCVCHMLPQRPSGQGVQRHCGRLPLQSITGEANHARPPNAEGDKRPLTN